MKESLFRKLQELASIPGPPGHEQEVVEHLRKRLSRLVDDVRMDNMGNVYARKEGWRPGPKVMVAAHADQIGACVKYIGDDGYIRMEKLGGILDSLLVGRKVLVDGHFGVVGTKSGHYQTAEERKKVVPLKDLYVDVGASSREEVQGMGIEIGDPITYFGSVDRFQDRDLVCGPGIDDRLGCAILLQTMEELEEMTFSGEFVAVITVQEEVGLRGAEVASYACDPDFMLALDTIPAGGTPDVSPEEISTAVGKGPIFPVTTGRGRGMITHPKVKDLLIEAAEEADRPYQLMVFSGGTNDATAAHLTKEGIPSGSVTLPRRYSHSPVELADLNDAEAAVGILKETACLMGDTEFSFV